jgi:hypothetical protein
MSDRPSLRAAFSNWNSSDLPFFEKLRLAVRNNAIKMRTRKDCCGHHGEPGC